MDSSSRGGAASTSTSTGAYPECAMLDALTHKQRYYMFNAVNPAYKSHAGKQMDPNFAWKQKTSPMVYSPEAGLVMYERVVVGQQEAMMLNKLSKPKMPRPPVAASKPTRAQEKLESTQMPHPGWAPSTHVERSAGSASAPVPGGSGRPGSSERVGPDGRVMTPRGGVGQRAQGPGEQQGAGAAARQAASSKYGIAAALQPSQEEQDMLKYVNRERAVMTASHVFTWGGRIKYSGPENGLSRQTWATGLSKPPLRL